MKSEPILKLLEKAMEDCKDRRGWDLARTYIWDPQPGFGRLARPFFEPRMAQVLCEELAEALERPLWHHEEL